MAVEVRECNRNAKRTKKLIEDAFYKLMEEKPCFKITVKELTEMADINRSTFYLHYLDIPDLIEHLEDDICNDLYQALNNITRKEYVVGKHPFHVIVFKTLKEHETGCKMLLGYNGDIRFMRKMIACTEEAMYAGWSENFGRNIPKELPMYASYVSNGIIGMFMKNLLNEQKWTPEEMGHVAGEVTNWLDEGLIVREARKKIR